MKNAVFWDVTPCGSCKSRRFGRFRHSVRRLLVTANVVPSSPILVILFMEELRSSETSVFTRATRHTIPDNDILSKYNPYTDDNDFIVVHIKMASFDPEMYCSYNYSSCSDNVKTTPIQWATYSRIL
jgi:hypothetical protein